MQVFLRKDVDKLGKRGEIKTVSRGFARNFLIPNKIAEIVTKGTHKNYALMADKVKKKQKLEEVEITEGLEKLKGLKLTLKGKVTEDKKLFGAITAKDIVAAIATEEKIQLREESIKLAKPIKEIGDYDISIQLAKDKEITVSVSIKPE